MKAPLSEPTPTPSSPSVIANVYSADSLYCPKRSENPDPTVPPYMDSGSGGSFSRCGRWPTSRTFRRLRDLLAATASPPLSCWRSNPICDSQRRQACRLGARGPETRHVDLRCNRCGARMTGSDVAVDTWS
eukprot:scaffold1638_cov258-Pinguiococcus_pyrenoidosus.AAC.51